MKKVIILFITLSSISLVFASKTYGDDLLENVYKEVRIDKNLNKLEDFYEGGCPIYNSTYFQKGIINKAVVRVICNYEGTIDVRFLGDSDTIQSMTFRGDSSYEKEKSCKSFDKKLRKMLSLSKTFILLKMKVIRVNEVTKNTELAFDSIIIH
ncbi:MAG: hypothetical protein KAQ98_14075 [Bacteriovoracaceae bacterium]|nr:hypothetical protein [Bacteriovoracaceae bacterium]